MLLGGVILVAGMQLDIDPGDYLHGDQPVSFTVRRVIGRVGYDWVILDGHQRPTPTTPWRLRRLQVRVAALRRCLALGGI